ncbi:PAS domain-containing sensor histidine kinase [Legionella sp.]|uniref:sensor histidine kinase n=1 Tax=Legionella sp. TaxID=459 RepID=UPI00321FC056
MNKRGQLTFDNLSHFLAKLAENSNSVYWLSTPDLKRIEYLSPAYETIWGRAREELYNDPEKWVTYLHPDNDYSYHPIHDMAERIAARGQQARFSETYRIIRPNGEIRWIVDRGFPIFDKNGCCHGVTGVAIDITQEKYYEEQLRLAKEKAEIANQAKSEFIANMSHDVRTPLAGILGLTQELIDAAKEAEKRGQQPLAKKVKKDGRHLFCAANALLNLFNEILEAIRVESGQTVAKEESFHLHRLIKQHLKLLGPIAQQKKLSLTCHIDQRIPSYVRGLRHHLDRSLLNLLSNAIKFTRQGYVKIIIEKDEEQRASDNGIPIKIKVQDSGIGIPADQFDAIFEQFSRLTPAYQGCYSGAGLGLYMIKHYMAEMKARIEVESEVGKGSCFTLRLALREVS